MLKATPLPILLILYFIPLCISAEDQVHRKSVATQQSPLTYANYFLQLRQLDSAEHYCHLFLEQCKHKDCSRKGAIYKNLGIVYSLKQDLYKAELYLNKAILEAQKHHVIQLEQACYLEFIKIYQTLNDSINTQHYKDAYFNLFKPIKNKVARFRNKAKARTQKIKIQEKDIKTKAQWLMGLLALVVGISLLLIGIFMQHRKLNHAYKKLVDKNVELNGYIQNETQKKQATKYKKSPLKDAKKEALLKDLRILIQEEACYLDSNLTLSTLASRLHTSRSYLSQVINESYQQNFNSFINEYRIKEARKLILDGLHKTYTIESISKKVGFRSKSSFNNAFKKFTGVTPSYFIANIN